MKHPEKWHVWPDEVPPEKEVLRLEVRRGNGFEMVAAVFLNGSFFYPISDWEKEPEYYICLFPRGVDPAEVYWRLWEDEE